MCSTESARYADDFKEDIYRERKRKRENIRFK
jgi:hypothetical protein